MSDALPMHQAPGLFSRIWAAVSRKALYVVVGAALEAARFKWPGLPLPSTDFVIDAVLALLAAHTVTDVVALIGATVQGYALQKHGRTINGRAR